MNSKVAVCCETVSPQDLLESTSTNVWLLVFERARGCRSHSSALETRSGDISSGCYPVRIIGLISSAFRSKVSWFDFYFARTVYWQISEGIRFLRSAASQEETQNATAGNRTKRRLPRLAIELKIGDFIFSFVAAPLGDHS